MNFVELLTEYGINFKRHGESSKVTEGWIGLPCPFCRHVAKNGDPNILGVNLRTGSISCWYDGVHRPGETLAALTGMPLGEAVALTTGLDRPAPEPARPRGVLKMPAPRIPLTAPGAGPHRRYLSGRGFDPDELHALWGLEATRMCAWAGGRDMSWRLVIPVTLRGDTVSWTTRAISESDPARRYAGARADEESVPKRELLAGWDYVRHAAVVVEGFFDAAAVGPGGVWTAGTGYTKAHVRLLASLPVRAVVFDAEPEAQDRADRLARELEAMPGRTERVVLESGPDPASASRKEIKELRRRYLR